MERRRKKKRKGGGDTEEECKNHSLASLKHIIKRENRKKDKPSKQRHTEKAVDKLY